MFNNPVALQVYVAILLAFQLAKGSLKPISHFVVLLTNFFSSFLSHFFFFLVNPSFPFNISSFLPLFVNLHLQLALARLQLAEL